MMQLPQWLVNPGKNFHLTPSDSVVLQSEAMPFEENKPYFLSAVFVELSAPQHLIASDGSWATGPERLARARCPNKAGHRVLPTVARAHAFRHLKMTLETPDGTIPLMGHSLHLTGTHGGRAVRLVFADGGILQDGTLQDGTFRPESGHLSRRGDGEYVRIPATRRK